MELNLYGAIVGKRLREDDANDPDAPPAGQPRRNVHVPLSPRRPWWRKTPAWVRDRCRALLDGADLAVPLSKRARAAWLEICRRLTWAEKRETRGRPGKRSKRK
jgi:hypothetical protein